MSEKGLPQVGDVIASKRFSGKHVVEMACMKGGGAQYEMNGSTSSYPDGWNVTARSLKDDGTYNPDGETINFYMTGSFCEMIRPEEVQIVGKMKMMFV